MGLTKPGRESPVGSFPLRITSRGADPTARVIRQAAFRIAAESLMGVGESAVELARLETRQAAKSVRTIALRVEKERA